MKTLAIGLLALAVACPINVQAQDATDVLTGEVTDDSGRPIGGALVSVTSLVTEITRATVTDESGKFLLLFPDGAGRYEIRVSFLGLRTVLTNLFREGDEEVLIARVSLSPDPLQLEGVEVEAARPPPGRGDGSAVGMALPQALLDRLPLSDFDPLMLAALAPGVLLTEGDSLTGLGNVSIAGQRDALNQVTLDGGTVTSVLTGGRAGGSPLGVPEEGVRSTQVVTSTYDVSRGQFSGGLIAITSARGSNVVGGSGSYNLQDAALQTTGGGLRGNASSQHRVSGGIGGAFVPNKLFYNLSFLAQSRSDRLFALQSATPDDLLRLGASPDTIARFLSILGGSYGVDTNGQVGDFDRVGDGISLMGRTDLEWTERHSIMLRLNGSSFSQDNAFVGPTELLQNGGTSTSKTFGTQLGVSSRLGGSWINQLRASWNRSSGDREAYEQLPEGRVFTGSAIPDFIVNPGRSGTQLRGLSTLVFGGDRTLPNGSEESTLEVANEVSFLLGFTHRLKFGAIISRTAFEQVDGANANGTYFFNSLQDFDANSPSAFTRSLSPPTQSGSSVNTGLYLGDTWRPTDPLQVTAGIRMEHTHYGIAVTSQQAVETLFGRSTTDVPSEWRLSPRLGFSYRLSERGAPLFLVRGGVGEFRGRAPLGLVGASGQSAGLDQQLVCLGDAVPILDWPSFQTEPTSIPTSCAEGSTGSPLATGLANAQVVSQDFEAPRSARASLGFQAQLSPRINLSADLVYARGTALYGVTDLNLDTSSPLLLGSEANRPVYGDPSLIASTQGASSILTSRLVPEFGHLFEIHSGLASSTIQASASMGGLVGSRGFLQANYTFTRSRDQSSFSCCDAQQGFRSVVTADDPNQYQWATSAFDRTHALSAIFAYPWRSWIDVSLLGQITSGAPFTPLAGGDLNGDGVLNDAAFLFEAGPNGGPLGPAMASLLSNAPEAIAECIESQLGQLAERNSCRDPWKSTVSLSATIRPSIPTWGIGDRLSLQIDALNVLAGVDRLVHGTDLHGWGGTSRSDRVLLVPTGFDAQANAYQYVLNDQFGQSQAGGRGAGGFQLQLTGRIGVGVGGAAAGGRGGGGFGRGGGGRGGAAGVRSGGGRGGAGGGRIGGGRRAGARGGQLDAGQVIDRALANPLPVLLELADTLGLSASQQEEVGLISAALDIVLAPLQAQLNQRLSGADPQAAVAVLRELQPSLQAGRDAIAGALEDVKDLLTDEQWSQVPAPLKNPFGGRRR